MDLGARRKANEYYISHTVSDLRHDLSAAFAAAGLMLVLLYLCGDVYLLLGFIPRSARAEPGFYALYQLVYYAVSILIPFFVLKQFARNAPKSFFPLKARMPQRPAGFVLFASGVTFSVNFVCVMLFEKYYPAVDPQPLEGELGAFVWVFMTVLLAPVIEELFFRGAVFGTLANYSPFFAVVVSALIFGLSHRNPPQAVNAFTLGAFLAIGYLKTGSVAVCVFIHIVNNAFSVIVQYALASRMSGLYALVIAVGLIALAVFAAASALAALFRRRRTFTVYDDPPSSLPRIPKRELARALFSNVFFWLFILLAAAGVWMLYI